MGFSKNGPADYQKYTDAEKRAYGERQREKERQAWNAKWITKARLKEERNWTDAAIAKFLPKPIKLSGRYRDYHVFSAITVVKAEASGEFKAWLDKRVARQETIKNSQYT